MDDTRDAVESMAAECRDWDSDVHPDNIRAAAAEMLLRLLTRAESADAAGHARGVREAAEACAKSAAHYREMIKRGHHAETFSAIAQALDGQAQALLKPAPAATDEGETT